MEKVPSDTPSVSEKSERSVSFLMLGKTGSGKTTLINSFVNHFNKRRYEDSKLVLIPQSQDQRCSFPQFEKEYSETERNEENYGKSKTQKFNFYHIENDERSMLIMDTPGMGDPRGLKQDQENIKSIIEGIKENEHQIFLQAIIFVIGHECKIDTLFKYYVDEIKKIMTKTCLEQSIVVCTRKTGAFPKELKKIVTESLGVTLPDDRWFTMDNTGLIEQVEDDDEDLAAHHEMQWNIARKTFDKIYTKATEFEKIPTLSMHELFQKRRALENAIEERVKIIEASKIAQEEVEKLEEVQKSIIKNKDSLIKERAQEKHHRATRHMNYNCLKCNRTCIDHANLIGYRLLSTVTLSIYHWVSQSSRCGTCNHRNSKHAYEKIRRFTGLDEMSRDILEKIEKEAAEVHGKQLTKEEMRKKLIKNIEDNMEAVAKLTVEVEHLGVISVTYDSYLEYLDYLIEVESQKQIEGRDNLQLNELKDQKRKYEEMKIHYTQIKVAQGLGNPDENSQRASAVLNRESK